MMLLAARFEEIADIAVIERRWRTVEQEADAPSFFLRWTWMGSWLGAMAAAGIPLPRLLAIGDGQTDVVLVLIGEGRVRRLFGSVPAIRLNEAGDPEGNRPFIEYNGLLSRAGMEAEAERAFCAALNRCKDWRALYLSGLSASAAPLADRPDVRRKVLRDAAPVRFVDLAAVRARDGDYLALLSANTRGQIRRSIREEAADLAIDRAKDAGTAGRWLAEMRRLNAGKHRDNAWESAFFRDFVGRIVCAGLADGSVELLRLSAGTDVRGYLLNFLWMGQAMNYQSAFGEPPARRSKPGLTAHAAAVTYYADRGLARYSFLAGHDRYKENLSTDAEVLHWWALERFDWRLEAEALARRLLRR